MSDNNHSVCDRHGNPLELVLYKYDSCGFCGMVLRCIEDLQVPVALRDTMRDPSARSELLTIGGKTQVPCLLINGKPLYESRDIIQFLRTEVYEPKS